ncbi:hypothetical protein BH11PSE5_BH11PSE5_07870 [soil metagenome]
MWVWKIARELTQALPMIALLALSPDAFAHEPIVTLPDTRQPGTAEHRMSFALSDGNSEHLAQDHKSRCERLGPARCRVVEFNPLRGEGYGSPSIKFILAGGTAPAFMSDISKSSPNGFTIQRDGQDAARRQADRKLEKHLLQAQRDRLNSLENSGPAERDSLIQQKRSVIEANLANIDRELSASQERPKIDVLSVDYSVRDQGQSWMNRKLNEIGEVLGLGVLIVTGTALLTALYLGILGFAFLWLRKVAIKRGLLKGA